MLVNIRIPTPPNPPERHFPENAAVQPSLKMHLRSAGNSLADARNLWNAASRYTAGDLHATMQEMSDRYPLGEAKIGLEEIKADKDRRLHPQVRAPNGWSDVMLAGLTTVTAVTSTFKFAGTTGNVGAVGSVISITPPTPIMPAGNASVVSSIPLMPDLKDIIDWRAFDEAEFLRRCGVRFGAGDSIPARLRGIYECFHPKTETTKLPLDIAQFNSTKIEQFVDGVMASTGYAFKTDGPTDPEFSRHLFKRWFLQLAAPQAGNDDDGHAAPFHKDLLKLAHPDTPHRSRCSDGMDAAPLLPRIGSLKKELRAVFLKSYQRFDAEAAYEWAFGGLCQLFEPTLVRRDLPEAFRYGSLAWVQLSIGIALAGDDHINWTLPELISLAAVVDVFAGDPDDASLLAIRRNAMRAVLRMAHAHGKLNLSTLPEIKLEDLESAFAFYQSQLSLETSKLPPLEELAARLPTRRSIAEKMLGECGIRDTTRLFDAFERRFRDDVHILLPNLPRGSPCIPDDKKYSLADIYMMDCLAQMQWEESPLGNRDKASLQSPRLTHKELEQRFIQGFDAAWAPLRGEILVPALRDQIEFMDRRDEEFWRCGTATVRIPIARVETRRSIVRRSILNEGKGPIKWVEIAAKERLLIELVLEKDGQKETRNYWAALEPFEVHRYTGSTRDLLKENMPRFFKPAKGSTLLSLSDRYAPTYIVHTPDGGQDKLLETISMLLVGDRGESLRESAHQTTEPEKFRAKVREMALDLIPFHACFRELRANEPSAAFSCTLDIASIIPAIRAGAILGKAGSSAIVALTKAEISQLGRALLFNSVAAGDRKTIATVFKVMPPVVDFAKEGFRLFDPGIELAYSLNTLGFRLGKAGMRSLLQKMRHYHMLSPIKEIVEKNGRQVEKFYPRNAYWHARSDAIMSSMRGRYVDSGGKRYGVFDWGENKNILTIQAGSDLRLVNPLSGIGYGPLLRKSGAPGRLELIPDTIRGADRQRPNLPVCRPKRAGDDAYSMICQVPLEPDARFGTHGYAQQSTELKAFQLSMTEAGGARLRTVNLLDIGFSALRRGEPGQSQTWVPAMPAISSFYNPASGRMLDVDSAVQGLPALRGRVISLMNRDGNDVSDYVLFSFIDSNAENEILWQTRYVPFGSYQEADGTLVGHFACAAHRYSFRVDKSRILSEQDNLVDIHPATDIERYKFQKYQDILAFNYNADWINYPGIIKLRGLSPERKAQFGLVMDRAETVLRDALYVLNNERGIVSKICRRFAANTPKVMSVINAIRKNVELMVRSFPHLRSESDNVIGFFSYYRGTPLADRTLNGFAVANSMEYPLGFDHLHKALINLRSAFLWDARQPEINKAMTLLHEWTHARVGTDDHINGVEEETIYAQGLDGKYDLQPLIDAAHISGAPASHASTLEHIVLMLAYARRSETRSGVEAFLNGESYYHRLLAENDFKDITDGIYDPGPAAV